MLQVRDRHSGSFPLMIIPLKYNRDVCRLTLPDERFQIVRLPDSKSPERISPRDLTEAFDHPVGVPSLDQFLRGKKNILLVVSDATRKMGTNIILLNLINYFIIRDIPYDNIKIIIATGIHRQPTTEEMIQCSGNGIFSDTEILAHKADMMDEMIDVGKTSFGNRILVNRYTAWADGILVCGAVGFHYFAGFSGGRKSIMPGLGWQDSIKANHNLVFKQDGAGRHPGARTASLEENPVHLDMMEAMSLVGLEKIFLINCLLSPEGEPVDVVCGHPVESHREACSRYLDGHKVTIDSKVDVVVAGAGGYPRDINMIQSHKAIEMARYSLREGGAMVILAACSEGLGHPSFYPWFRFQSEEEFRHELTSNYVINGQTALALFEKTRRYRIFLVSQLPTYQVRRMGMTPCETPEKAVQHALECLGENYRGLVLPEAPVTYCRFTS